MATLLTQLSFSQMENTIWYFGQNNGITFPPNGSSITSNTHSTFSGSEGCGIVTDPITGEVIFYSDGISLYDKNDALISNALGGDNSAAQALAFCQVPGNCDQYYIFANDSDNNDGNGTQIFVHLYDVTTNSLLPLQCSGTTLTSNEIIQDVSQSMTIVRRPNTPNYWLIGKKRDSNVMYSIEITDNFLCDFSSAVTTFPLTDFTNLNTYCMEYSADADAIHNTAIAVPSAGAGKIYTMSFDSETGIFSNANELVTDVTGGCYDVEFSPNGQFLYYSTWTNFLQLNQYRFSNGDIENLYTDPEIVTANQMKGGGLKTGPDDRIYFMANRNDNFISIVNNPNSAGTACNFDLDTELNFSGFEWEGLNFPATLPKSNFSITSSLPNGSNTICSGTEVVLTVEEGLTFDWESGETTNSITVHPLISTNYSCITTDLNGCEKKVNYLINVIPAPNGTIDASLNAICVGQNTTLTFTNTLPGVTYTWNNGLNNQVSHVVSPTVTTTYSCTASLPNGCTSSDLITIVVNPNVFITAPTIVELCPGNTTTLTVSVIPTNTVLTWSNGFVGASINVNPLINTSYTVSANNFGCTDSKTILVNVSNCNCGTVLSGTITSNKGGAGVQVYKVNSDLTISGNRTFSDAEFIMAPNVKIIVPSGAELTVRNVHLYSCAAMWEGFVLNDGGNLSLISSSTLNPNFIEDAKIAVNCSRATNTSNSNSKLKIEYTTFNRNRIALRLYNQSGTYFNNNFTFLYNVVTSRNIPFTPNTDLWNLQSIRNIANPQPGNPHSDQYIKESDYPSTGVQAFLKEPYTVEKPLYGVELNNNRAIAAPEPRLKFGNSTTFNIFDNLKNGIYCINSTVQISNNYFQNSKLDENNTSIGYGIYSNNTNTNLTSYNETDFFVSSNTFVNIHQAIFESNNKNTSITNNTFRSNRLENSNANTTNHPGKTGIQMTCKYYELKGIKNNFFYNIETGIVFTGVYGSINGVNQQSFGEFEISGNTFKRSMNNNTYNGAMRNAIVLNNITSTLANTNQAIQKILILNNTIQDVYRGIRVNGFKQRKVLIDNNYGNPSPSPAIPEIRLVQSPVANDLCFGVQFTNNINNADSKHIIKNVKVNGFGYTYNRSYGIYVEMSERTDLACNEVKNTYHGLYFKGLNPVLETANNKMENHQYGFTLDNYGTIGTQGSTTNTTGNIFNGSWPANVRFKTATLNFSSAQNSKMYVKNNSLENPNGSSGIDITQIAFQTNYFNNGTTNNTIVFDADNSKTCSSFALAQQPQNPNSLRSINEREHFKKIINHEVIFEMNPVEKEHIAKQQIYTVLRLNPDLMENESDLEAFFNEHEQGNIGKIDRVEKAFEENNITIAIDEINNLIPENQIEFNYKRFYEIYEAYINGLFSDIDNSDLFAIASGCPQLDGVIVFQARSLYEFLNGNNFIIESECLETDRGSQSRLAQEENINGLFKKTQSSILKEVLIYPNPTKDKFYITATNVQKANISLFDLQGRNVYYDKSIIHENLIEISNISNKGIFTLIIENNSEKLIKKIILE